MNLGIGYVVLYVKDTKESVKFWTEKVGFIEKRKTIIGNESAYLIGKEGENTNFELVPLKIMENNPHNLNLGIPSIALSAKDLEQERKRLIKNKVKVSEINEHEGIKNFTIFDNEENAYAVIEL